MDAAGPASAAGAKLVYDLGLRPAGENLFVGVVSKFPLSLKFILTDGRSLLLAHIRYPGRTDGAVDSPTRFGGDLSAAIDEKSASLELEQTGAWLEVRGEDPVAAVRKASELLKLALEALTDLGLAEGADRCHRCHISSVDKPSMDDGTVEFVCDGCKRRAVEEFERTNGATLSSTPRLFLLAGIGALVAAAFWGAGWIAYDELLQVIGASILPTLLLIIPLGVLSWGMGESVAWMLKHVEKRGPMFAPLLASVALLAAAAIGDLLLCSWLLFRSDHGLHLADIPKLPKLLPTLYLSLGVYRWVFRIGTLVAAVAFAASALKPKRTFG